MKRIGFFLFLVFVLSWPAMVHAAVSLELKGGAPINVNMPMYYWFKGIDDGVQRVSGRYHTAPFEEAPYYSIRLGYTQENADRWELELIHHKVIMDNPPAQHFRSLNISHGYNFILVNHTWQEKYFAWRLGAGIILAHPEIVKENGETIPFAEGTLVGFYVAGVGVQAAIERRFFLYDQLYFCPEIKFTAGIAQVDVVDGFVNLPNIAFHFTAGLGYQF